MTLHEQAENFRQALRDLRVFVRFFRMMRR